jgi:hypothetical protein
MSAAIGRTAGSIQKASRLAEALMASRVGMDFAHHRTCLAEHPRLVVVLTHGGAISFLPVVMALVRSTAKYNPERRIVSTWHQGWWRFPGLNRLPRYLTGAERAYSLQELQRALAGEDEVDYYALPESETSLYGDPGEVKPFRFHGFIELSIRTRSPMLLVAHKGTEGWYRQVDFSGRLSSLLRRLPDRVYHTFDFNKQVVLGEIAARRLVNVPLPLRRAAVDIGLELHCPDEFETGLDAEFKTRRRQVLAEGERIRTRLQQLYDALG